MGPDTEGRLGEALERLRLKGPREGGVNLSSTCLLKGEGFPTQFIHDRILKVRPERAPQALPCLIAGRQAGRRGTIRMIGHCREVPP
jgi:hypothetical protein